MANTCFTYDYMRKICVLVKFKKDKATNTYQWVYTGGCFEGGKAVLYKQAQVGEKHAFKRIKIEVRVDQRADAQMVNDPQTELAEEDEVESDSPRQVTVAERLH